MIVLSAVVLIAAAALGVVYSTLIHKVDLHASDQITIAKAERLTGHETEPTTFTLRPDMEGRANIAMIIEVVNPGGDGNCEGQTRMYVSPMIDGARQAATVGPIVTGQEFRVSVAGAKYGGISVQTSGQPAPCQVNLRVREAVAYNDFPW